jgi:hypothetical protein
LRSFLFFFLTSFDYNLLRTPTTMQQYFHRRAPRSKPRTQSTSQQRMSNTATALARLERRLEAADAKRTAILEAIRARAAAVATRQARVASVEASRRRQLALKLEQNIKAAELAREARLAATAAKAARRASRAKAAALEVKEAARAGAEEKRLALKEKLERAERARRALHQGAKRGRAERGDASVPLLHGQEEGRHTGKPHGFLRREHRHEGSDISATAAAAATGVPPAAEHRGGGRALPSLEIFAAPQQTQENNAQFNTAPDMHRASSGFAASQDRLDSLAEAFIATGIPFSVPAVATTVFGSNDFDGDGGDESFEAKERALRQRNDDAVETPPRCPSPPVLIPPTATSPSPRVSPSPKPLRGPTTPPLTRPFGGNKTLVPRISGIISNGPTESTTSSDPSPATPVPVSPAADPLLTRTVSDAAHLAASVTLNPEEVPVPCAKHATALCFDEFAAAMSSPETLQAIRALLGRLESLGRAAKCLAPGCEVLLKRLFPRLPPAKVAQLERYSPRPFLSAYMVLAHPEVVLNGHGLREEALSQASIALLSAFERLLLLSVTTPCLPATQAAADGHGAHGGGDLYALLARFDRAWVDYLGSFLAWKGADAAGLEADLIRAAVELEASRIAKLDAVASASRVRHAHDLEALSEGVDRDLELIAERILKLTGTRGVARLDAALNAARASSSSLAVSEESSRSIGGGGGASAKSTPTTAVVAEVSSPSLSFAAAVSPSSSPADTKRTHMRTASIAIATVTSNPLDVETAAAGSRSLHSLSPTRSPAKKTSRLRGAYRGPSSAVGRTSCDSTMDVLESSESAATDASVGVHDKASGSPSVTASDSSSNSGAGRSGQNAGNDAAVAMEASATDQNGASKLDNISLMWQLLYDPTWRLSTSELELMGRDALGDTDPLQEQQQQHQGLFASRDAGVYSSSSATTDAERDLAAMGLKVRRIAEKAFWDDVRDTLLKDEATSGGGGGIDTSKNEALAAEKTTGQNDHDATFSAGKNNSIGGQQQQQQQRGQQAQRYSAAETVATLLCDLGKQLCDVLPSHSPLREDIMQRLGNVSELVQRLTCSRIPHDGNFTQDSDNREEDGPCVLPGLRVSALLDLLAWAGRLVSSLGAPARDEQAAAATQRVHSELAAATQTSGGRSGAASPAAASFERNGQGNRPSPPTCALHAMATAVTRALRLLAQQLSLLRIDVANAHLAALASQLTTEAAISYARDALQRSAHLGRPTLPLGEMSSNLPHTRGWLAVASGALPHVELLVQSEAPSSMASSDAARSRPTAAAANSMTPVMMRSGLRHHHHHSSGSGNDRQTNATSPTSFTGALGQNWKALQLQRPVAPRSWQGLVRRGLVQLVAGEGAVTVLALPETLQRDAGRLFAAQNDFQRVLVLTTCLLAIAQLNDTTVGNDATNAKVGDGSSHNAAAFARSTRRRVSAEDAVRRLSAVLAAPDVKLADVAADVAAMTSDINDVCLRAHSITSAQKDSMHGRHHPTSSSAGTATTVNAGGKTASIHDKHHEATVHGLLKTMLGKSSPAMRAITTGLGNALTALLLCDAPLERNAGAMAALMRCGAMPLKDDVATLAAKLSDVAAVTEAVCGPWYDVLSSDLLFHD